MDKHAFLVMAHNHFGILEKIIVLLDDDRNDFYIHIDKKVKDFDFDEFKSLAKKSNVFFVDRSSINWGGYSQIKCELTLLKSALKGKYSYYHLISGVDMPLKSSDEIHKFFELNSGKEFVHFSRQEDFNSGIYNRFNKYHFLQEHCKSNNLINQCERVLLKIQSILGVNRNKDNDIRFGFGSNWFSITHELADYVVSNEQMIYKLYKNSACCDEIFLQTLVLNSDFKNRLFYVNDDGDYYSCVRFIDWKRGNPYVFKKEDYNDLINSKCMFARKFDLSLDKDIVELIFKHLKREV